MHRHGRCAATAEEHTTRPAQPCARIRSGITLPRSVHAHYKHTESMSALSDVRRAYHVMEHIQPTYHVHARWCQGCVCARVRRRILHIHHYRGRLDGDVWPRAVCMRYARHHHIVLGAEYQGDLQGDTCMAHRMSVYDGGTPGGACACAEADIQPAQPINYGYRVTHWSITYAPGTHACAITCITVYTVLCLLTLPSEGM